jgi:hypothetical protein
MLCQNALRWWERADLLNVVGGSDRRPRGVEEQEILREDFLSNALVEYGHYEAERG